MLRAVPAARAACSRLLVMQVRRASSLRNIGVIAHIDAGKTTTTERMLALGGHSATRGAAGEVDSGDTVTDFMDQERERGITIQSAAVSLRWRDCALSLIDTPGHVDFTVEVERCMRVLDGAVLVVDAASGVQAQTETVWRQASRHGVAAVAFVNKMDRAGADLASAAASIEARLGCAPLILQHPLLLRDLQALAERSDAARAALDRVEASDAEDFVGTVDLATMRALVYQEPTTGNRRELREAAWLELPGGGGCEVSAAAAAARERLVESAADVDDAVADLFLEGEAVGGDVLIGAATRACQARAAVPLLCGSSLHGMGVEALMDACVAFLPPPEAAAPPAVTTRRGERREVAVADPSLVALVFKVIHDAQGRPISMVRVYSGTLRGGSTLRCGTAAGGGGGGDGVPARKERAAKVLRPEADALVPLEEGAPAGSVCAVVGLKSAQTGDTLTSGDAKDPLSGAVLDGVACPAPVFGLGIEPELDRDQDKLDAALETLCREDPSLRAGTDEESGQVLLRGMGELHIEVVRERLRREFGVETIARDAYIAYREALEAGARAEAEAAFEAGAPGAGRLAAAVRLRVDAAVRDDGTVEVGEGGTSVAVSEAALGALASAEEREALVGGLEDAAERGPLLGYPLLGAAITVEAVARAEDVGGGAGKTTPGALRGAAAKALAEALRGAGGGLRLLEPLMRVELSVPDEHLGGVLADLTHARRGRVRSVEPAGQRSVVLAEVPLEALLGYATALRGQTRGEGSFSMEYLAHGPVDEVQKDAVLRAHGR